MTPPLKLSGTLISDHCKYNEPVSGSNVTEVDDRKKSNGFVKLTGKGLFHSMYVN